VALELLGAYAMRHMETAATAGPGAFDAGACPPFNLFVTRAVLPLLLAVALAAAFVRRETRLATWWVGAAVAVAVALFALFRRQCTVRVPTPFGDALHWTAFGAAYVPASPTEGAGGGWAFLAAAGARATHAGPPALLAVAYLFFVLRPLSTCDSDASWLRRHAALLAAEALILVCDFGWLTRLVEAHLCFALFYCLCVRPECPRNSSELAIVRGAREARLIERTLHARGRAVNARLAPSV
jgi:hypothetical protein